MKICPACGNQYSDDANFCPMDASRLPEPVAAATSPAAPALTMRDGARSIAGRYLLGAQVAATPTGELFEATDGQTGHPVRLKILDARALPSAMLADRALREYKQLGKVKSERIARVLDQGKTEEGRVFFVTESLAGASTLEELVARDGALSFERARHVILAVGEALTEAQKVGVIHRDVAPRNVLLVGDRVKLTDFGVAEPVADKVFGAPAFLSPEQAEGKPVDQRSNIYSLGALFYYALTGSPPFEGDRAALLQQHLHAQPKPPSQRRSGLTPEIDKLALKALEKSGGRRHLTLRQMLNEIEALPAPGALGPVAPRSVDDPLARTMHDPTAPARAAEAAGVPVGPMAGMPSPVGIGSTGVGADGGGLGAATVPAMPTLPAESGEVTAPVAQPMPVAASPAAMATPAAAIPGGSAQSLSEQATRVQPAAGSAPAAATARPAAAAATAKPAGAGAVSAAVTGGGVVGGSGGATASRGAPAAAGGASSTSAAARAAAPTTQARPLAAQAGGPAAARPGVAGSPGAKKKGFRETAWFKRGELEEEAAKVAAATANPNDPLAGPAGPPEVAVDDSQLTQDDRARLSLKTGRTEAMPVIKPAPIPGERMSDEDLLAEVDSSKKWMVIGGFAVAVLALLSAIYFLFIRASPPG